MKKRLLILLSLVAFGFATMAQDTIGIFTFDGEEASTITLGHLVAGDIVNGETITSETGHNVSDHEWGRVADSATFLTQIAPNSYFSSFFTNNPQYFGSPFLGNGTILM